jgi:hypothetical protein
MTPKKDNKPISRKEEIAKQSDRKIREDFNGYPIGPARDETINPQTEDQKRTAALDDKDGEKRIIHPDKRKGLDEQDSDGSANAFDDK